MSESTSNTVVDRSTLLNIVVNALDATLAGQGDATPSEIDDSTVLFGRDGLLDSLGLVTTVVEIESKILSEFDASVVLADDRAMSQRNSPFRTVGTLTDHILSLLTES